LIRESDNQLLAASRQPSLVRFGNSLSLEIENLQGDRTSKRQLQTQAGGAVEGIGANASTKRNIRSSPKKRFFLPLKGRL